MLAQAEVGVEKETKERSTKMQKAQKQVEAHQAIETKGKGIAKGSKQKGKEKVKNPERKEKEKHEVKQARKRKNEWEQLDTTKTSRQEQGG